MNIVLCGVDGSFKSTIAKKLEEKLNLPVVQGSSFEHATGSAEELYNFTRETLAREKQIVDRTFFSNTVYTRIYPEYTALKPSHRKKLKSLLKEQGSIVVYLTASADVITKRIEKRGDEHVTTDKISSIINEYNAVMSEAVREGVTVYTYDTGILSSDDVVRQVIKLPELYDLIDTTSIGCTDCKKTIERRHSYFCGKYCFHCYLNIMEELFSNE